MKNCLTFRTAAAALLLSVSGAPHAQDMASMAWDLEARVTTDQRSRGVSDSLLAPGVKLTLQAAHESGVVGLLELSTVSKKQFLDGAGVGIVAGAGYRFGDPELWHFGAGVVAEWFPDAKFEAPHAIDLQTFTPLDVRQTKYDSLFLLFEAGYGPLEGRVLSVVSKTYRGADTGGVCGQILLVSADPTAGLACYGRGDHDSRGTLLADLNYRIDLNPQTALNLQVGRQKVRNFEEADTTDYALGVTHKRWGFGFSADWLAVNVRVREVYLVPDGNRLRATDNNKLVLSASRKY